MKISLILATVKRTAEVGRCLRSLAAQSDKNFDVLLVDQNQDDRLLPFVAEAKSLGVAVDHIRMDLPSLSGARNLGLSKTKGEIIGLTDDDCWYDPHAVGAVRAAFQRDPALDGVVAQWVEQAQARPGSPASGQLSLDAWRRFRGGDASSISLFFKVNIFTCLGGFDEQFGIGQWFGAGEETDFVLRALTVKARLAHCPAARVHHKFGGAAEGSLLAQGRNARNRARGTGGIYAKHRLGAWTVIRGFIAPVVRPLARGRLRAAVAGAFVSLGRFEGFFRWKLKGYK